MLMSESVLKISLRIHNLSCNNLGGEHFHDLVSLCAPGFSLCAPGLSIITLGANIFTACGIPLYSGFSWVDNLTYGEVSRLFQDIFYVWISKDM